MDTEGLRTLDPLTASQVLYQAELLAQNLFYVAPEGLEPPTL